LEPFGRGIGELQRIVGDHFAHTQGGRFASPAVAQVLAWLESQGIRGVGQSSWGPTGFAVIDSESRATKLVAKAKARFGELTPLRYRVVRPRNRGSLVELRDAENRLIERYGNNASG
jgi:predicted sugar kinase